ncbi:MAG: hypothetical protein M0Z79_13715 [Nitrospiraceae bacterium]|nr:hypothetical protein [Nitrospiraceae bacterium]
MRLNVPFRGKSVFLGAILILVLAWTCETLYAPVVCSQEAKKEGWGTPLRGHIKEPVDKSRVSRHFNVSGTITGGPIQHLWLIERIGNQHWPKEPELRPANGRWQGEVFEGGNPLNGAFEILLVDVSAETARKFREWVQTGHRTGSYPGIQVRGLGKHSILDTKTYTLTE